MLMYVIPLIILIVVLLVVKKRQDAQESSQPTKKGNTKSKAKKSNSTRPQARPTPIVEDDDIVVADEPKQTQPIPADTRKKIESLIRDRNFFAAEAQINQALKRDNTQHELYLLLLDVHLEQKDDFAVKQLLSHLNALELHEIAQQADAKITGAKNSDQSNDSLQFDNNTTESAQTLKQSSVRDSFSKDAFDALISTPSTVPQTTVDEKPASEEVLLEFTSPSLTKTQDTAKTESEDIQLDFTAPVVTNAQEIAEPVVNNVALEFNPSFTTEEAQPQVEEKPVVDEIKPLDFSFTLSNNEVTEEKPSEAVPVSVNDEPLKSNEFNLDFVTDQTPVVIAEQPSTSKDEQPEFSFNLDFAPTVEDVKTTEVALESNLNTLVVEDIAPTPASTEVPLVAVSDFNIADPLVQSFPSLAEINEIELNLDLAKKYIELGAYDAARAILAENDADYSTEQRQVADQLLNQIAS